MSDEKKLVLMQYRENAEYNDFIGKYYHFPEKYINHFSKLPIDFIYYEPQKQGNGGYFGCGTILRVFQDKKTSDHFYAEIEDYKPFVQNVPFKHSDGSPRETGPGFNQQNAVRVIQNDEYESIKLEGSPAESFTADANLISVLGEQLIANEKVGILELIKNSYDAGSTSCKVYIENIPNIEDPDSIDYKFDSYGGPVIVIEDNGKGMTYEEIVHGWLRPASTLKTDIKTVLKKAKAKAIGEGTISTYESIVKEIKKNNHGRIPLGEKGVGRFATHRLGRYLEIITKTKENDYELKLCIDWAIFEKKELARLYNLSDINVNITKQALSTDYGEENSGTRVISYGGKDGFSLTREFVEDLSNSISMLKSPKKSPRNFDIEFSCPQFINSIETSPIIDRIEAPVRMECIVDDNGIADIEIYFKPSDHILLTEEKITEEQYSLFRNKNRKPTCGAFYMSLEAYYRTKEWVGDAQDTKELREYLDAFGGISVFRDGLNIFEAKWGSTVDWLNLLKRHIKRGVKLSYYNLNGSIDIDQENNLVLSDKTDRQGFINNEAYSDFVTLVRGALLYLEIYFISKRDELSNLDSSIVREPAKLLEPVQESAVIIDNLLSNYDIDSDPDNLFTYIPATENKNVHMVNLKKSLKNMKKSLEMIDEVQEALTEHAGYGLAVATSVHEIAKITSNFYVAVSELLKAKDYDFDQLKTLKASTAALKTELKRLGPLKTIRNESRKKFNITDSIKEISAIYTYRFKKKGIAITVDGQGFELKARYGAVNQILSNLFSNSEYWLGDSENKKIFIKIDNSKRIVIFADSGPGISELMRPNLFQPGYSLKIPPSGFGLYVCSHYMKQMKGRIYEAGQNDVIDGYGGAQFVLDFSKVDNGSD